MKSYQEDAILFSIQAQNLFFANLLYGNNIHYRATKFLLYIEKNFIYPIASDFFFL